MKSRIFAMVLLAIMGTMMLTPVVNMATAEDTMGLVMSYGPIGGDGSEMTLSFPEMNTTTFHDYWSENATKPRGERAGILADMPTLALAGAAGCGKTHVAVGTLRRLAIRGGVSSWQAWTVAELLSAHKATFDDRETRNPLPDCVEARVLLLDDLGAHGRTAWAAETLLGLIDARYRTNPDGVLILTTNAGALGTAGFWASLLGEEKKAGPVVARLASRLSEGALLVPFGRVEGGTFTPLRDERKGGE